MDTKTQLRVRIRILAVLAIVGALGTGIGLWLLIAPIHYIAGESCGSVFAPSFPANDDSAVSSCLDLRGGHREDGWFLVGIGLVGLVGGGRAAYLPPR